MVLYNIRAISSCIIMFLFISCKSDIKKINKYYQPNIEMHHVIADTLIKFVKKYKREVDIKVRYDLDSTIFFIWILTSSHQGSPWSLTDRCTELIPDRSVLQV